MIAIWLKVPTHLWAAIRRPAASFMTVLLTLILCPHLNSQTALKSLVQVDTDVIELNQYGFSPKQITRPLTAHFIYVRNVTHLRNLTLRLTDQIGVAAKVQGLTTVSPHWRELLVLLPGKYTLTEDGHPGWTCSITITP